MKSKTSSAYFPVDASEQALLLRVREPDLAERLPDLLVILDQIAESKVTSADLEVALQLLQSSRQGEGLEARFANLEARLDARIEKGLEAIEGRLAKRLGDDGSNAVPLVAPTPSKAKKLSPSPHPPAPAPKTASVPASANLAFRIGDEIVWGETAAQFYVAVWRWLFEHGHVKLADLPIGTGKKRYLVARTPMHPSGKPFFRAAEPVTGAYLELNMSRANIATSAGQVLGKRGVSFQVLVGPEDA